MPLYPCKNSWWRRQMKTFSALLALCKGNPPVTGEFPSQKPLRRSFDFLFDLRLNKRLSKPSIRRWFGTPSRSLTWKNRKHLKAVNIGKPVKIYINEDLTTQRAKLFSVGRSLLKDKHIEQVWTFNDNIKIKTLSGHVKSIQNMNDFKACLPNVNIRTWFDRSLVTIIIHFYILSITALDVTLVAVDALVTESLQHLQLQGWLVFLLN